MANDVSNVAHNQSRNFFYFRGYVTIRERGERTSDFFLLRRPSVSLSLNRSFNAMSRRSRRTWSQTEVQYSWNDSENSQDPLQKFRSGAIRTPL